MNINQDFLDREKRALRYSYFFADINAHVLSLIKFASEDFLDGYFSDFLFASANPDRWDLSEPVGCLRAVARECIGPGFAVTCALPPPVSELMRAIAGASESDLHRIVKTLVLCRFSQEEKATWIDALNENPSPSPPLISKGKLENLIEVLRRETLIVLLRLDTKKAFIKKHKPVHAWGAKSFSSCFVDIKTKPNRGNLSEVAPEEMAEYWADYLCSEIVRYAEKLSGEKVISLVAQDIGELCGSKNLTLKISSADNQNLFYDIRDKFAGIHQFNVGGANIQRIPVIVMPESLGVCSDSEIYTEYVNPGGCSGQTHSNHVRNSVTITHYATGILARCDTENNLSDCAKNARSLLSTRVLYAQNRDFEKEKRILRIYDSQEILPQIT